MSRRPIGADDGGYTASFLAFKYGLSDEDANRVIRRIGLNRALLDKAAMAMKAAQQFKSD